MKFLNDFESMKGFFSEVNLFKMEMLQLINASRRAIGRVQKGIKNSTIKCQPDQLSKNGSTTSLNTERVS